MLTRPRTAWYAAAFFLYLGLSAMPAQTPCEPECKFPKFPASTRQELKVGTSLLKGADPSVVYYPGIGFSLAHTTGLLIPPGNGASHVNVVKDPTCGYHMFYVSGLGASIGHAWSRDGITFVRNPGNPVVDRTTEPPIPGATQAETVCGGPAFLYVNGVGYLYYMVGDGAFSKSRLRRRKLVGCCVGQ